MLRPTATLVLLALALACDAKEPPTPPAPVAATPPPAEPEPVCNYFVLVDASSSASRSYAFQIDVAAGGGLPTAMKLAGSVKVEPGLAAHKAEPAKAGESITALLGADGGVLKTVPEKCRASTPTAVMATAGMRMLEGEEGGEAAARAIYDSVTAALKAAGLDARFAGTISGQQEALYAWISANHALGNLAGDKPTVGALDLGGASTQIAFVPADPAGAPTLTARFGDRSFAVYAQSYLGYGQDLARTHLSVPACDPKGLDKGTGKYAQCVSKLDAVAKPKTCPGGTCGLSQPGDKARVGVAQPAIPAGMKFYATSVYYYARKFFELPEQTTPAALREAAGGPKGTAGFCGTKWADLTAKYASESPERLGTYCFSAAWIDVLLKNLGFAATTDQIYFTDKIGEADAGWAAGAALCSVTGCLSSAAPATPKPAEPAPADAPKPAA